MSTTFERLQAFIVKDHKLDPGSVTPDTKLEKLGIDSLGAAELLFDIGDEFDIDVPPEQVRMSTVADVVAYIDGLIAAQRPDAKPSDAGTPAGRPVS